MRRLLWLLALPEAACLLGTAAPPTEATPEMVERVLKPSITFELAPKASAAADEAAGAAESVADWRKLARSVAQLQQLDCDEDVLGAQVQMVDAAEEGDKLAMAALGTMFLLGQECARKRNLTWGYHYLSRAAELGQPDALALMGFLHTTDVLRDLYNFSAIEHDRAVGMKLLEKAAAGGSPFANLAMGYRYANGVGVVESCPTSGVYYESAALHAAEWLDERRPAVPTSLPPPPPTPTGGSGAGGSGARPACCSRAPLTDGVRGACGGGGRARTVEQSNPNDQEHLTVLSRRMPPRDKMDNANIECALTPVPPKPSPCLSQPLDTLRRPPVLRRTVLIYYDRYVDYCATIGDVQGMLGMGQMSAAYLPHFHHPHHPLPAPAPPPLLASPRFPLQVPRGLARRASQPQRRGALVQVRRRAGRGHGPLLLWHDAGVRPKSRLSPLFLLRPSWREHHISARSAAVAAAQRPAPQGGARAAPRRQAARCLGMGRARVRAPLRRGRRAE